MEIRRLGPVPETARPDVEAVAVETMRRALPQVERIVSGFADLGFAPASPRFPFRVTPLAADRDDLQRLGCHPTTVRVSLLPQ